MPATADRITNSGQSAESGRFVVSPPQETRNPLHVTTIRFEIVYEQVAVRLEPALVVEEDELGQPLTIADMAARRRALFANAADFVDIDIP